MKKRLAKGTAMLLTAALGIGLMPAASWMAIGQGTAYAAAAATNSVASAAQGAANLVKLGSAEFSGGTGAQRAAAIPQGWTDQPNATAAPSYFTFDGEQILEGKADVGDAKGGAGGSYLALSDSMKTTFPVAEGKLVIEWQDRLGDWIKAQDGTAISPPSGYTVSLKVKEIISGRVYSLIDQRVSKTGMNRYEWNGKDENGQPLPDGFYYVQLSADKGTVTFETESSDPSKPPKLTSKDIPDYDVEYVRVALDRTAPVLAAVHPLGDGKLAVEARDGITGVKKLLAEGGSQAVDFTFSDQPQQAAYAFEPGNGEKLHVTLTDEAGNKREETVPLKPYVPDTGKQGYQAQAEATVAGQSVTIGLAQGNGHQVFQGFSQQGPGVDLDIYFTYNHQNRVNSSLGYGWSFNLDSRLQKWNGGDDVTWLGLDGASYWFHKENGEYVTYVGGQKQVYPKLSVDTTATKPEDLNAFVMEWPEQLRYRFKDDGRFWLIQDRDKNEVFFEWISWPTSYGHDYRIQKVRDTAGHEVNFGYTLDSGDLTSTTITELDGVSNVPKVYRKFFFMYNSKGDFVGYRDPSQKITRFVYDDLHRVKQVIDNGNNVREESGETPESVTTQWTYDADNRVTRIGMTRKQDSVQEFVGVAYGSSEAQVDKPSGSYTLRWNEAFRPTEKVQTVLTPEGKKEAVTTYKYSGNLKTEETDPLGRTQRWRYDADGQVSDELKPNRSIWSYEYDIQGDLKTATGPDGFKNEYAYMKVGRHIESATKTAYVSDPAGINAPYTVVTKEQFNDNGLLASQTDGEGNVFAYTYDENGFVTSDGTDTTYENNIYGNVVKQIQFEGTADESTTVSEYDLVGRLVHRESALGLIEDFTYDIFGRLTQLVQRDAADAARQVTYTKAYDDGGNLVREFDGLKETTYTVDGEGRVTSTKTKPLQADTSGEMTSTTEYDSRGLVTKSIDSRGLVTVNQYNEAGDLVMTVASPDDQPLITRYEYDANGRLFSVTAPDGGRTEYAYDAAGRVTQQKEIVKAIVPTSLPVEIGAIPEQTLTSAFRYDSIGQLVEQKQPDGSWTRYAYDGNGKRVNEKSGGLIPAWKGTLLSSSGTADTLYAGHEVLAAKSYAYDKLGRLRSETDANGNTTTYSYDGRTTTTSNFIVNESGQKVKVTRSDKSDANGNVIETINEANEHTTASYDAFGAQTESVNEEGQSVINRYDSYGRLTETVETIDAEGKQQIVKYDNDAWGNARSEQRQTEAAAWITTRYVYSPAGDLLQTTEPSGLVTKYEYDLYGRVTKQTESNKQPGGSIQVRAGSTTYDAAGNEIVRELPDGGVERNIFDTAGNLLIALDAEGNAVRMEYANGTGMTDWIQYKADASVLNASSEVKHTRFVSDGLGQTVLIQDPNGNLSRKQYDGAGNMTAETYSGPDLNGESITLRSEYDSRGLLTKAIDGESHVMTYAYDAEGQNVRITDPVGQWVAYQYSPAGQLTDELYPLGKDVHSMYNYRGDKLEERDALSEISRYTYDLDGSLLTETSKEGDITAYRYDQAGRMTEKTVPNSGVYTYKYDGVGNSLVENRPEGIVVRNRFDMLDRLVSVTEQGSSGELITAYTYDHVGNKLTQQDPNGQITRTEYDESGQKTKEIFTRQTAQGTVQDIFEYTYDPNGNLLTEKKPGGLTTVYTYDFMNRKTSETFGDGSKVTYTYDNAGNVLTMSGPEGSLRYEYYDNNQLKKTTYSNGDTLEYVYDENGDVKSEIVNGKPTAMQRDAAGRTTTYTDTKGYSYSYEYRLNPRIIESWSLNVRQA